jgi:pSer/pThr/pTyr-binding forkhead associated (FHA) protein
MSHRPSEGHLADGALGCEPATLIMSDETGKLGDTTQPTSGSHAVEATAPELTLTWIYDAAYKGSDVLRAARVRIGRGSQCHVRLEHASVSREHAELYRQGPITAVRDLGSTNGTYLNGSRCEHGVLSEGCVLRVGDCVGVVGMLLRGVEPVRFGELAPGLLGGPTLGAEVATLKATAKSDVPIMIIGETGSGKERIARAIHELSGRGGGFHALNCSALSATLAETELFGHERGAFTGADRAREGHLRAAHRGTLFLDEIADLPLSIQTKLLRAVEEGAVTPVGATQAVPFDARIVVAAQEPLERYVERKTFRADLYARLAGFRFDAPPLRRRRDEIPGLFFAFLEKHGRPPLTVVTARLLERLCTHDWPGNVRELELCARKLVALARSEEQLSSDWVARILPGPAATASASGPSTGARDRNDHDLRRLNAALVAHDRNMSAAAASIGISRRRAYRLLGARASIAEPEEADQAPPREKA